MGNAVFSMTMHYLKKGIPPFSHMKKASLVTIGCLKRGIPLLSHKKQLPLL